MTDNPDCASTGHPPTGGWAGLVPELIVSDLGPSLAFWCDGLGFRVAYRRPAEKFVYLERADGAQVMLCQRHGQYETGPLQPPLGRGVMLQVYVASVAPVLAAIEAQGWQLYEPVCETWHGVGSRETGMRRLMVQDPDGYLLMIAEHLGERTAHGV